MCKSTINEIRLALLFLDNQVLKELYGHLSHFLGFYMLFAEDLVWHTGARITGLVMFR